MTRLTLDLPPELFQRLRAEADDSGKPVHVVALEWLARPTARDSSTASVGPHRDSVIHALRGAGLLTELTEQERQRAARSSATLEEIRAVLDRDDGAHLSTLIEEMRGPKE